MAALLQERDGLRDEVDQLAEAQRLLLISLAACQDSFGQVACPEVLAGLLCVLGLSGVVGATRYFYLVRSGAPPVFPPDRYEITFLLIA